MNRRTVVLGTAATVALVFVIGALLVKMNQPQIEQTPVVAKDTSLIRSYAPVIGNANAPVTIVEFFDSACEACRAFHPVVKGILEEHGDQVRVILRLSLIHI